MALAFGASSVFAQTLTSKKGETILPESGDWSIGFDASPFFHYVGTMFSTANANPTANWLNGDQTIVGKYYVDATTAYRATLRIGMGSTTQNAYSELDQTTPDPTATVKDSWKHGYHNIVLGAGIEKRMGKTRLQGYYGGEAMIMLSGSSDTYTYGNAISATYSAPIRANFNGGANNLGGGDWLDKANAGSTFGIGVRGIIGAEYFIFPKISIGAEYDWGVMFSSTGDGSATDEVWNGTTIKSSTMKTAGASSFGVDTGINTGLTGTGSIVLNLHF